MTVCSITGATLLSVRLDGDLRGAELRDMASRHLSQKWRFESQRNFLAIASSAPPMPPAVGFQLPPPSSTLVHHFCCVFARRNLHLFCLCGCCLIAVLSLRGDTRGLYMLGTKPDLGVWVDVFTMQALHSELAEHLRSLNGRHCKRLGSKAAHRRVSQVRELRSRQACHCRSFFSALHREPYFIGTWVCVNFTYCRHIAHKYT